MGLLRAYGGLMVAHARETLISELARDAWHCISYAVNVGRGALNYTCS